MHNSYNLKCYIKIIYDRRLRNWPVILNRDKSSPAGCFLWSKYLLTEITKQSAIHRLSIPSIVNSVDNEASSFVRSFSSCHINSCVPRVRYAIPSGHVVPFTYFILYVCAFQGSIARFTGGWIFPPTYWLLFACSAPNYCLSTIIRISNYSYIIHPLPSISITRVIPLRKIPQGLKNPWMRDYSLCIEV